jgi:hypothetical protein
VCTEITLRVGTKHAFGENVRILVARGKPVSGMDWEHGGLSETVEARRAVFYKRILVCGKEGLLAPSALSSWVYMSHENGPFKAPI